MPRKDRPVKIEPVERVVVSQLADGRAVVSVHKFDKPHTLTNLVQHYLAGSLLLSKRLSKAKKRALIK